jgi:DnaJ-class molecular chaperone
VTAESEYEKLRLPSGDEDAVVAAEPAHETLGVAADAPAAVVKAAHRELVKEAHPDQGGSNAELKRINEAKAAMLEAGDG